MVAELNICFCNFDIEVWRTDLLFKLVSQLDAKGHNCHYYNYKNNIMSLAQKRNIPLTFHDEIKVTDEPHSFDEELINLAGSYSFGLNERKGNREKNNEKIRKNINKFIFSTDLLQGKNDFDLFVVWGGFRYKESSIISYAKSKGIKVVIFEYGYFRPYSLTFEKKGLNYDNSLPRTPEFYLDKYNELNVDELSINDLVLPKSARFNAIDPDLERDFPRRKRALSLTNALKFKNIVHKKLKTLSSKTIDLNQRYIFVPFQVETDSQIIQFSQKIKSMKNLVALVSEAVEDYNKTFDDNIKVIFKPHPVDKSVNVDYIERNMSCYKSSLISFNEDTQDLIKNSELVITINSTVGIEALINGKNVITLGDAFYNIDGLVKPCKDYDNLHLVIKETLLEKHNSELVFKYLKYLKEEYFSEIYYEGADPQSISDLCNRLEQV